MARPDGLQLRMHLRFVRFMTVLYCSVPARAALSTASRPLHELAALG